MTRHPRHPTLIPYTTLFRSLPQKEEAAGDQDEVTAGNFLAEDREERLDQPADPGEQEEEPDAHEHGEEQSDPSRELPARLGHLVHENGNEDDVVDAEHELERREREKGDPGVGIGQHLHRKVPGMPTLARSATWCGLPRASAARLQAKASPCRSCARPRSRTA